MSRKLKEIARESIYLSEEDVEKIRDFCAEADLKGLADWIDDLIDSVREDYDESVADWNDLD